MNSKVNVDRIGASKGRNGFTYNYYSQKCLISPEAAKKTLQKNTQRGITTILHPPFLCQFKTNEQALRYNRLNHNVFTDTIKAGTVSRKGN